MRLKTSYRIAPRPNEPSNQYHSKQKVERVDSDARQSLTGGGGEAVISKGGKIEARKKGGREIRERAPQPRVGHKRFEREREHCNSNGRARVVIPVGLEIHAYWQHVLSAAIQ